MTTAMATKAFKSVGQLSSFLPLNPKKITTIKKVISFTTDKKSADGTDGLIKFLSECLKNLPTKEGQLSIPKIKANLKEINRNLSKVKEAIKFIDVVFDGTEDVETEIKIDDKNMIKLIANFNKAKDIMQHISDYLTLVLQVDKEKSEHSSKKKLFSLDELVNSITSKAA